MDSGSRETRERDIDERDVRYEHATRYMVERMYIREREIGDHDEIYGRW